MILILYADPALQKLLSVHPVVAFHPLWRLDSLSQFQRRRVQCVLCEWCDQTPPAAILAQLFPGARLATLAARFQVDAAANSRRRGFGEHYCLPLPKDFFEEMERAGSVPPGESVLEPPTRVLQLLEKRHDYESLCRYLAETLRDQLSSVNWSVHVQDKERNWKMVFASPFWKMEWGEMAALLRKCARESDCLQAESSQPGAKPEQAPGAGSAQRLGVAENLFFVPIIKDGAFGGVILSQNTSGLVHPAAALGEAALLLGTAFHHIDMLIEKERLTFTDTLTSLFNYRYLRQFLANELRRCSRYHKTVSILFIDIDWFKHVNDNHGHLAGSDTLVEVSSHFSSMVRDSDIVVRYGGDEFVVVLTETTPAGAETIAERVRKSVESHIFGAEKGRNIQITVSIGIAGYPEHGFSVDELIRKADSAMYDAKNELKNTVRVAG